jgi:hypothetical protein
MKENGQLHAHATFPQGKGLQHPLTEEWMGPTAGLNTVDREKNIRASGGKRSLVIPSHCTDQVGMV